MFLWLRERLNEADVIVSFNIITGMTSLSYSASLLNKKKPFVIFPFYHVGLSTFERPSLFKILRDATLVICSTNFERQTLINRGLDSRKLRVVNEGVRNPLVDVAAVHRIEEILDRREGQLLLMYVGRRDYDKGYSHVLSAVSQLVRSGVSIKLVVCGQGKPCANGVDYLFLSTRNAIIDLEVADERTKVAAMSLSDVVVLPSRAETYPLAFVESWLLGKPVIGARIGSVSSMVKEGVDGLLVEFGDVPGLIATIKSLYNNPEKRIEMGKNGQTRARKELTLEKNIARIRKIFNEISGQGLQID
jgi:glycosyltransferase involved in cell wall biosynthesis